MATFVLDPASDVIASVPRSSKPFQRRQYRDKQFKGGEEEWKKRLDASTTVYVGNLSCYTNEYQLYELFARCGSLKRIIMGLDKIKKTPCGFCFVEFDDREGATKSISFLNRTHLDGREIQVDIDAGFEEGRQYGRGSHGGQVADERRREREMAGQIQGGGTRAVFGGGALVLTRSITIVACLTLISLILIVSQPEPVVGADTTNLFRSTYGRHHFNEQHYRNMAAARETAMSQRRADFEQSFAQFLVGIMKAAKPTLLKAFIQATLADKQLKEIAIGLFFNNTSTNDDSE